MTGIRVLFLLVGVFVVLLAVWRPITAGQADNTMRARDFRRRSCQSICARSSLRPIGPGGLRTSPDDPKILKRRNERKIASTSL